MKVYDRIVLQFCRILLVLEKKTAKTPVLAGFRQPFSTMIVMQGISES